MIGYIQQILADYAYNKGKRCPWAIVIQPANGDAVCVERCKKEYGHKGPHECVVGGVYDIKRAGLLQLRLQWRNIMREDAFTPSSWEMGDVVPTEYDQNACVHEGAERQDGKIGVRIPALETPCCREIIQ